MRIRVLGSGAGGGVPQWNCGCANCQSARLGDGAVRCRTQDSLALSHDGAAWFLMNASPDVRQQIESFPALHPRASRHSPIAGIILTNGDLDHCLGLLLLRESHPLVVYATEPVWTGLVERNAMFRTLRRRDDQLAWTTLRLGQEQQLAGSALWVTALPAPGNVPLHLVGLADPSPEQNIAVRVHDRRAGKVVVYAPGAAAVEGLAAAFDTADCVFLDGTFYSSDELIRHGGGTRTAEEMAHLPVGGPGGSLARLAASRAGRKLYTHINNTNPMLREGSAERRAVAAAGWQLAEDGMEVQT